MKWFRKHCKKSQNKKCYSNAKKIRNSIAFRVHRCPRSLVLGNASRRKPLFGVLLFPVLPEFEVQQRSRKRFTAFSHLPAFRDGFPFTYSDVGEMRINAAIAVFMIDNHKIAKRREPPNCGDFAVGN